MEVFTNIRDGINSGKYKYGKKMPTIKEFSKQLNVSPMTVKKALDELAHFGYIEKRQGSGIYVKMNSDKIEERIPLTGNSGRFPDHSLESVVISFSVTHPSTIISEKLSISEDDFVYKIERLRVLDKKPIIMEYTFMPINVIPGITARILKDSIYKYIREQLNLKIASSNFEISGVRPSENDKKYLHLTSTDFVMKIVQTVYLSDGTAFEYSIDKHVPEEFKYSGIETDF